MVIWVTFKLKFLSEFISVSLKSLDKVSDIAIIENEIRFHLAKFMAWAER